MNEEVENNSFPLTVKGQALKAKIELGEGTLPLEITRVVTASGYSDDPLNLENVVNLEQTAVIMDRQIFGTRAEITILLTNFGDPFSNIAPLQQGYELRQFGMYALDPDEGEILYRIAQLERPNWIPPARQMGWVLEKTWNFSNANASDVVVEINPTGIATREYVHRRIEEHNRDKNAHVELFRNIQIQVDKILEGGLQKDPSYFIINIPIERADIFNTSWALFENKGGINNILEDWGFTNAILTEIQSRIGIDINTSSVNIYSTAQFGNRKCNRKWIAKPYIDNVYILTNDKDSTSLILIRKRGI